MPNFARMLASHNVVAAHNRARRGARANRRRRNRGLTLKTMRKAVAKKKKKRIKKVHRDFGYPWKNKKAEIKTVYDRLGGL